MTRLLKLLGGAALALLGAASAAQATIVHVTYEGVVKAVTNDPNNPGNPIPDLFGGGNLVDQHYTASYVFDVVNGPHNAYCGNCGGPGITENYVYGGYDVLFAVTSPLLEANLTIGGYTVTLGGAFYAEIHGYNESAPGGLTEQYHWAIEDSWSRELRNTISNNDGVDGLPGDIVLSAFDYIVKPSDDANGYFCVNDIASCIYLTPTSLHVTAEIPDSVPLPGALPLFVSGLAGLGLLARRRKRQA